jgi:DeoR family deoxyribose operon repressor
MTKLKKRLTSEVELIGTHRFLSIKQLAQEVGVSEMTVRRDLAKLESDNLVRTVYGGVTLPRNSQNGDTKYTLSSEQNRNKHQKEAIIAKASEYIEPGDVIFLDSGTTIQMLAEQIPSEYSYTIITSSYNILEVVIKLTNSTIICPGGIFSEKPLVFYDLESANTIRRYRANKAFIGATGFELELGLTCGYLEDAPLKRAMIESSKEKILLIDSTKFGRVSTCPFASIDNFTTVITDSDIPDVYRQYIKRSGVDLIIV